ncbi:MAG: hypothetical protein ACREEP_01285 [Dongiaceae bacterium]
MKVAAVAPAAAGRISIRLAGAESGWALLARPLGGTLEIRDRSPKEIAIRFRLA